MAASLDDLFGLYDQLLRKEISAEDYHHRRVKLINRMTHSSDPVIDVESDEEDEGDDMFISKDLLSLLEEEISGKSKKESNERKRLVEVGELMEKAARAYGVRKGLEEDVRSKARRVAFQCAAAGRVGELESLLKRGIDVNARDSSTRNTLLGVACERNHDKLANKLLDDWKANPRLPNLALQNALHCAAAANANMGLLQALAQRGADPKALDHMGCTPLSYLPMERRNAFEEWLRDKGLLSADRASDASSSLEPLYMYVKSGTRYKIAVRRNLTVGQFFRKLPAEFARIEDFKADIGILEYRRKTAQRGPSFVFLDDNVVIMDRVKTWEGDHTSDSCTTRLMLVPRKGCPPTSAAAYNKAQL